MRSFIFFIVLIAGFLPVTCNAQERVDASALDAIYNSAAAAFGNERGVPIVEFYDYQCHYCKGAEEGIERLVQEGSVRLLLMDFPKLGEMSNVAATATLAALKQGADKYYAMHNALMNKNVQTSESSIMQAAAEAGIDVDRMKQDMSDPAIAQEIQDSITLGKSVGVKETPSFIVGGYFFPGYADYDKLKEFIAYAKQTH